MVDWRRNRANHWEPRTSRHDSLDFIRVTRRLLGHELHGWLTSLGSTHLVVSINKLVAELDNLLSVPRHGCNRRVGGTKVVGKLKTGLTLYDKLAEKLGETNNLKELCSKFRLTKFDAREANRELNALHNLKIHGGNKKLTKK